MGKSRYSQLLDKSIQAALAAIELYNKPIFSYREESFSILMVNACELLLKSKRLKDNRGKMTSLYIPISKTTKAGKPRKRQSYKQTKSGNFMTLSLLELVSKEIVDKNLILQLETLIEIRDNSIHFMNSSRYFEKQLLEVAAATLKSYKMTINNWFDKSLDDLNLSIIPISFNLPQTFNSESLSMETESHKKLLDFISMQRLRSSHESTHDIALVIDVKLKRSGEGVQVRFDKDGIPLLQDTEEVFKKKYPISHEVLLGKLKKRYTDFKQNPKFNKLKREIHLKPEFCGERYLDYERMSGSKKRYYSSNVFKEFDENYTKL